MEVMLDKFLKLEGDVSEVNSDNFIYELTLTDENFVLINELHEGDLIEAIRSESGQLISINNLDALRFHRVDIEFVTAELKKLGYYLFLSDFIIDNRFKVPSTFYVKEIDYSSSSKCENEHVQKYLTLVALIETLVSKAKFISDEHHKVLYMVQENSFLELPIENIVYEDNLDYRDSSLITQYIRSVEAYQEKKIIFIKELIDYLSGKPKSERLKELVINFNEFFERCNASFEYYLSNFSFNKIKLELDNSVLEHSKNIRSIINDAQSKLIAIPAAFVLAVSQVNYENPIVLKNLLIILSVVLFSYIISVFIKNQRTALEIVRDNIANYKINYKYSHSFNLEYGKDLQTLTGLINSSFDKTEKELNEQKRRLRVLQFCNWSISVVLPFSILIAVYLPLTGVNKLVEYIVNTICFS